MGTRLRTRLLASAVRTRRGRVRTLAAGVDLLDFAGPGHVLQRWRQQRRLNSLGGQLKRSLYEQIWTEAAAAVGAELRFLPGDLSEFRLDGSRAELRWDHVSLDSPAALERALDKPTIQRALMEESLPTPTYWELDYDRLDRAEPLLAHSPLVIKPARGTGAGEGVTPGIVDWSAIVRAGLRASRNDSKLLIERQVEGGMYRLLVLDGELLDVVHSTPPHIHGDGRASIGELIARENEARLNGDGKRGLALLLVDLDCALTLERQGLSLEHQPADGTRIMVKQATNQNAPSENLSLGASVSPMLEAAVLAAARASGLRLAGVDVITPDPSVSLRRAGGVILEVNGNPGLHHHYLISDEAPARPIAIPILQTLLQQGAERSGEPAGE